jgi:hypothetical protein
MERENNVRFAAAPDSAFGLGRKRRQIIYFCTKSAPNLRGMDSGFGFAAAE